MENWVKILVIFIILIVVITADLALFFKTENLVKSMQNSLNSLENVIDRKLEKISAKELKNNWKKTENIFAFFIEQEEIEKVSLKIASIEENIENEEYENALEDIAETKYLLKHIQNKYNLYWKNVF